MDTRSTILLLFGFLIIVNAFGTISWLVRSRLLRASAQKPSILILWLTGSVVITTDIIAAYSGANTPLATIWYADKLTAIAKVSCIALMLPCLWVHLQEQFAARTKSSDAGFIILFFAVFCACYFMATSIGRLVAHKLNPPFEGLPLIRRLFFVYKFIAVYIIYMVSTAVACRKNQRSAKPRELALNIIILAYTIEVFGMIGLYLYFPDYYKGELVSLLNIMRMDTCILLSFVLGIYVAATSEGLPKVLGPWVSRILMANILLTLSMPVLAVAFAQTFEFVKSNTVLIISTFVTAVVTVVATKLVERAMSQKHAPGSQAAAESAG